MDIQNSPRKTKNLFTSQPTNLSKMVSQTKKSKISLAILFLNLSKIRKKESLAEDSLVLQLFGQLVSLLKSTNNLKLENLAKKFQKQTKHLGKCGLIPHSSF